MSLKRILSCALASAMTLSAFSGYGVTAGAAESSVIYNFAAGEIEGAVNLGGSSVALYDSSVGYGFVNATSSIPSRSLDTSAIVMTDEGATITENSSSTVVSYTNSSHYNYGGLVFRADVDAAGAYRITVNTTDGTTSSTATVAPGGMQASRLTSSGAWDSAGLVKRNVSASWSGANTWTYDYVTGSDFIEIEIEPKNNPSTSAVTVGVESIEIEPLATAAAGEKPTVFIMGDSTAKSYTFEEAGMSGWGQVLDPLFDSEKINVVNYSMGGRSFKAMYTEGRFNDVLLTGKAGDYVLVQSGHNDESTGDSAGPEARFGRGSDAEQYEAWITDYYVPAIKAMGMIPILVTPMTRINGGSSSASGVVFSGFANSSSPGIDFPGIMKTTAEELGVEVVDLYQGSMDYMNEIGGEATVAMFMSIEAGETPGMTAGNSMANGHPDQKIDGTHFKEAMAKQFARIIATYINGLTGDGAELKNYLTDDVKAAIVADDWSAVYPEIANDMQVGPNAYYRNQVEKLLQLGVLSTDENGKFNPKSTITVGEFAEAIKEAWDLEDTDLSDYTEIIASQSLAAAADFELDIPVEEMAADSLWLASEDVTAGDELMTGLTPVIDLTYTESTKKFGGYTFSGYVSSSTNGSWASGAATGTALKFVAPADGLFTVYVTGLGETKIFSIAPEGVDRPDKNDTALAQTTGASGQDTYLTASVEKGKTYYAYVAGSKGRFAGAKFEEPKDSYEITSAQAYEDGTVVVSAEGTGNAVVLGVEYDADGRLIGIVPADITESGDVTLTMNYENAKVLIWNNLDEMIPYASKSVTAPVVEPDFVAETPVSADLTLTREYAAAILYDAYELKFGKNADGEWNKPKYMTDYNGGSVSPDDPTYDPNLTSTASQYYPLAGWGTLEDTTSVTDTYYGKMKEAYNLGLIRTEDGIARGSMKNGTVIEPLDEVTREKAAKLLYFCWVLAQDIKDENDVTDGNKAEHKDDNSTSTDTIYRADDSAYDNTFGITEAVTIGDLTVGPNFVAKSNNVTYTYTDGTEYNFTRAWQGGTGSTTNRYLCFTPTDPCLVTVVFTGNGNAGRIVNIAQNGTVLAQAGSLANDVTSVTADVETANVPVYVYGGGSNKEIYAIIVEYVEPEAQEDYVKTWDFAKLTSLDTIQAAGLVLSGAGYDSKGYLTGNSNTTIKVPADPAVINEGKVGVFEVSYCFAADFDIEGNSHSTASGSTSNIETAEFIYTAEDVAEDGYVTINVSGTTYFTSISRTTKLLKEITGAVTTSSVKDFSNAVITFTNTATGNVTKVAYADNYTVNLVKGYTYEIGVEGVEDVCASLDTNTVTVYKTNPEHPIEFVDMAEAEVVGDIVGLSAEQLENVVITFTNIANEVTTATVNAEDATLSVTLMPNQVYTLGFAGVDGYSLSTLSSTYEMRAGDTAPFKNVLFEKDMSDVTYPEDGIITVGSDKDYPTVYDALIAIRNMSDRGNERIVVEIDPGVYREQLIVDQKNVTFRAADIENPPVLSWYYGIGYSYYSIGDNGYYSRDYAVAKTRITACSQRWGAAVRVTAAGFLAEYIDFENSFNLYMTQEEIDDGVTVSDSNSALIARDSLEIDVRRKSNVTERAAAIALEGANAELYRCSFKSSQDTFYTNSTSAYVKECVIQGNTDYIFGGSNIVFDDCDLVWGGYTGESIGGYITASSNSSTADNGYLFVNCTVKTADPTYTYGSENQYTGTLGFAAGSFGRNWGGATSQCIFLDTVVADGLTKPTGWVEMGGALSISRLFVDGVYAASDLETDLTATADNPNGTLEANGWTVPTIAGNLGAWVPVHYDGDVAELTEYTTEWYFGHSNGSETFSLGANATYSYSASSTNDPTSPVMEISTGSSGKLDNSTRTDEWAQFNSGTTLTIPVVNGSVIDVTCYSGSTFSINGKSFSTTGSYTYVGEAGTIDIVSLGGGYISSVKLVSPVNPAPTSTTTVWDFVNGDPAELTSVNVANGTTAQIAGSTDGTEEVVLNVDATTGSFVYTAISTYKYAALANGAKISIDAPAGSELTVTTFASLYKYTLNGTAATAAEATYTLEEDGTFEIVSTGNCWIYSIKLVTPLEIAPTSKVISGTISGIEDGDTVYMLLSLNGVYKVVDVVDGAFEAEIDLDADYGIMIRAAKNAYTSSVASFNSNDESYDITLTKLDATPAYGSVKYNFGDASEIPPERSITYADGYTSSDGMFTLAGNFCYWNDHGLSGSGYTVNVNVPAGTTTVTFYGCAYSGSNTVTDGTNTYNLTTDSDNTAITPFTYTGEATTLTFTVSGGYLHGMNVETVEAE